MAKYDHGGGCPCGLQKECDCKPEPEIHVIGFAGVGKDGYATPVDTGDRLRKDDGKSRLDLLPPEALEALGHLYRTGAQKYAPRGWEEGMSWGRCLGALMRHVLKWMKGEDYDPETGAHHLIAVAWNAFALYTYHVRKLGTDDRSKI